MRFELAFETSDDSSTTYGLAFIPSPVWVQGRRQLLNLNPDSATYSRGSVRRLMVAEGISARECTLIVYPTGNGTMEDLGVLLQDLLDEGITVRLTGVIAPFH